MSDAEFDRHADHYRDVHRSNIAISGELPEYFAAYKMRDFAHIVDVAGSPQDGRYLDFGCGIGTSIRPFFASLPRARLLCADVSEASLAQAKQEHAYAIEFAPIKDGTLPAATASLDGAFACCVFHHIAHTEHLTVLAELRRVLKPGAPLMIYEHNPYNPLTVRAVKTCPLDENAVLIPARTMRHRCGHAGFTSVEAQYRVFFPASLKVLRPLEDRMRWLALGAQYLVVARA